MATNKQLHLIARNPRAYQQFVINGRMPELYRPTSPLIELLQKLSPNDRCAIIGLKVDQKLGYSGFREFRSAHVALTWALPESEMLRSETWPAESWRIKSHTLRLTLEDVLENAASYPKGLELRYRALCRPAVKASSKLFDALGRPVEPGMVPPNKILVHKPPEGGIPATTYTLAGVIDPEYVLKEFGADVLLEFIQNGHPRKYWLSRGGSCFVESMPRGDERHPPFIIFVDTLELNPGTSRPDSEDLTAYRVAYPCMQFSNEWKTLEDVRLHINASPDEGNMPLVSPETQKE